MATNDALDKIFVQLSNLTTHVTAIASNIEVHRFSARIEKHIGILETRTDGDGTELQYKI